MLRIFCFLVVFISFVACKEKMVATATPENLEWQVAMNKLPAKKDILPKAQELLENWKEYLALEASFDKLYALKGREDLVLLLEEIIEHQKKMEEAAYPEAYDIPHIKARQKVFKTYVLKAKGDLEYRINPQESLHQMVVAFNHLRNQFDVVAYNILPKELLLNEEN